MLPLGRCDQYPTRHIQVPHPLVFFGLTRGFLIDRLCFAFIEAFQKYSAASTLTALEQLTTAIKSIARREHYKAI